MCDSPSTDFGLREMQPGDAEAVSALITQLGYSRSAADVREWFERLRHEDPQQAAFVACDSAGVIGWIEIAIEHRLQSPPFALIGGLVVKDGARSRGVGRKLCERAEAWAWEQDVETVRVTSRSTRADAHRFYLRDGYRQTKTSLVFEKKRERHGNSTARGNAAMQRSKKHPQLLKPR